MDLFEQLEDKPLNLLPYDGMVNYYGPIMKIENADRFYKELLQEIAWRHDEAIIFGKHIVTNRKIAWYADRPVSYTDSNTTKTALSWTPILRELKALAELWSGETYNSCLLNHYHKGDEGMAWH